MPYSATHIADQFVAKSGDAGIDPMKLLKLAYLAQGWSLGLYGEPLIWEDVEAWKYGPVFRQLYSFVAGKPLIRHSVVPFGRAKPLYTKRETQLLDQVWDRYKDKSGLELSALTHAPGSPWDVTYKKFGQNAVIPKTLIEDYYSKKAA